MTTTYHECFNAKLDEFLKDLIDCFPGMKDIKLLKSGLQLSRTMDITLPQKVFNEHIHDIYENNILNKDESFFMNENYQHIVDTHGLELDVISKIKTMWTDLSVNNKDVIWKYLQVLVLLNRKCKSQ